jgi:hypothetical protein
MAMPDEQLPAGVIERLRLYDKCHSLSASHVLSVNYARKSMLGCHSVLCVDGHYGDFAVELAKSGRSVTLFDVDPEKLQYVRGKAGGNERLTIYLSDGSLLPCIGKFGGAACLWCGTDGRTGPAILKMAADAVRPGGVVAVSGMDPGSLDEYNALYIREMTNAFQNGMFTTDEVRMAVDDLEEDPGYLERRRAQMEVECHDEDFIAGLLEGLGLSIRRREHFYEDTCFFMDALKRDGH